MDKNFTLYLDIDGVLVSYLEMGKEFRDTDTKHKFKEYSVTALNTIIDHYKIDDICMISSWNSYFDTTDKYKNFLVSRGLHIDNLRLGDQHDRSNFIFNDQKKRNHKYLIIDDEGFEYLKSCFQEYNIDYPRILIPNRYRCLDSFDADQVIKNWKL